METKRAWSKRRWLAEYLGADLKEVEHYQRPQDNEGVQLLQYEGEVYAVAVTENELKKAIVSMGGPDFVRKPHWKDATVSVLRRGS